jgi:CheY-like chemotaxis protein
LFLFVKGSRVKSSDVPILLVVLQILDPIEKAVPLIITLDPDTPSSIVVDNLKVFRAALALLCLACARTTKGYVMLRIYMEDHNLVFACESTGPSFEECEIASFIDPDHDEADHAVTLPCLRLAAKVIQSLHGTCGYTAPKSLGMSSLLWFSVPDGEVSIDETDPDNELSAVDEEDVTIVSAEAEQPDQAKAERSMTFSVKTHHSPKSPLRNGSWDDLEASLPRPKKVLVIDDSLVVRKTMQRALSTKFGYEVTLAKDGMEGLAKLQETVYDFVLIDFLMPVMDGWDCTQQYRNWEAQHRPWFRQHIIGMSAHANEKDVTRARQFGMDDYRCKPVTIDVLCGLSEDLKICQIQKQLDYLLPLFDKATGQKEDAGLSPLRSPVKRKLGSILCLSSLMIPCDDRQRGASHVKSPKRVKPSLDVVQPVCLVCRSPAADSPWSTLSTTTAFEQHGWKVEVVQTSDEALARLKQRNYDAVIIENDLAPMSSGVGCITQFREWEGKNRVNRQKNALLQFSKNCAISKAVKAGGSIIVQPPAGFDGVLGGETVWEEFESIVGSSVLPCLAKISGIVMR